MRIIYEYVPMSAVPGAKEGEQITDTSNPNVTRIRTVKKDFTCGDDTPHCRCGLVCGNAYDGADCPMCHTKVAMH